MLTEFLRLTEESTLDDIIEALDTNSRDLSPIASAVGTLLDSTILLAKIVEGGLNDR